MTRRSRFVALFSLAFGLAIPFFAVWAVPHAGTCVLKGTLGVPCPGCGLGHSLLAVQAGHWLEACQAYPPLLALFLLYALGLLILMWRGAGRPSPQLLSRSVPWVGSGTAATVVVHWAMVMATR
ncbi:MAG: DUF2752 domain-containing protein [Deltaproteobacteria bacterium]|nr:DUF2752 domain-containing protein [Deltaproteobacteria bacterium]